MWLLFRINLETSNLSVNRVFPPGNLYNTHQPLKILENGRPRHSEGGDPRRGTGGAGGHGRDRPRWAGAPPRPDPLVPRPQPHPDSGNGPQTPLPSPPRTTEHTAPDTKGIKSHKPFNSTALPASKPMFCSFLSAFLKNGLCPKNKSPPSNFSVLLLS